MELLKTAGLSSYEKLKRLANDGEELRAKCERIL